MHLAIRYLTEYGYDAPVCDNLNALRVRPATTSSQRCDEFHTRIDPDGLTPLVWSGACESFSRLRLWARKEFSDEATQAYAGADHP